MKTIHLKYLISNNQDSLWGLVINSVGSQYIEPNSDYPPKNHPTRYLFSATKGRILNEYQLIYISQGKGFFVSDSQKKTEIKAGNMFLLYPNEWHNYAPDPSVGWHEYWIGFEGINIDNRIKNGFFDKKTPIFNIGAKKDITDLYNKAIDIATNQQTGFQQMLAGIVNYLLGIAYSQNKQSSFDNLNITKQLEKAKIWMSENFQQNITAEQVAEHVNMSYSWFRRMFKGYSGLTPYKYIVELRIQKAKELLSTTNKTNFDIAFAIGFDNPDYFCAAFKKKTDRTPMEYRKMTQGLSKNPTL